jgi:HSP20 family molecular chaperone IbpA
MSTLSLWARRDPFAEFDALIRNAFGPVQTRPSGFTPAAEVTRDGEDAVVRVELPGLDVSKDVTVEVENGHLVVRGERRDEHTKQRDGASLREVRYGSFRRSFGLPKHVVADAISASYDAGVLTVRVTGAYADGEGAKRIEITPGTSEEAPAVEA